MLAGRPSGGFGGLVGTRDPAQDFPTRPTPGAMDSTRPIRLMAPRSVIVSILQAAG